MSVPMLLYVLLFNYAPLWGWVTAFQDYQAKKGMFGSPWVGLDNFKWLFGNNDFLLSIRNTLAMSLINLVFGTVSAVLLAVLLNEVRNRSFKRTVQTVTYLPHFLSMVIVVSMAQNIFVSNGPVNELLLSLGIIKEPVFWLGEGKYFWWLVGVINVWKEVGWGTIIYISAMTAIDPCLYEAAAIDGAGRWKQTLHVTIPGLVPTVVLLSTLAMGNVLNAGFDQVFNMYNQLVISSADIIDTYVYRIGITNMQFSLGTAAGLFKSVVSLILVVISYSLAYKFADYSIF